MAFLWPNIEFNETKPKRLKVFAAGFGFGWYGVTLVVNVVLLFCVAFLLVAHSRMHVVFCFSLVSSSESCVCF